MSTFVSFFAEGPVAGLAVVGLNLLVGLGLIAISLALGIAVSLLIGLPALVTQPRRVVLIPLTLAGAVAGQLLGGRLYGRVKKDG